MVRLPTPGSDDGSWGTILNDFLAVEHNSDGALKARADGTLVPSNTATAKGDLLIASAASTVTKLPVGSNGQVLTSDSSQATGAAWKTPVIPQSSAYPLSAYGFHSASDDLGSFSSNSTLNGAFFTRVFVPAGNTINAIATIVRNAGTLSTGGLNSFAIFDDAGTLIASTPSDDNQWLTAGWLVKTFTSPIAAVGSDRFVYAALVCNGYSVAPNIHYATLGGAMSDGGGYLVSHRRSFYGGVSSWPSSFNPATYGSSGGGYIPIIALG